MGKNRERFASLVSGQAVELTGLDFARVVLLEKFSKRFSTRDSAWTNFSKKFGKVFSELYSDANVTKYMDDMGIGFRPLFKERGEFVNLPTVDDYVNTLIAMNKAVNYYARLHNAHVDRALELHNEGKLEVDSQLYQYLDKEKKTEIQYPLDKVNIAINQLFGPELLKQESFRAVIYRILLWQQHTENLYMFGAILYWFENSPHSNKERAREDSASITLESQQEYNREYKRQQRARMVKESGFGEPNKNTTQLINDALKHLTNVRRARVELELAQQYLNDATARARDSIQALREECDTPSNHSAIQHKKLCNALSAFESDGW